MALLRAPRLSSFPKWLHLSAKSLLEDAQGLASSLVDPLDPLLSESQKDEQEQAQLLKPTSSRHVDWVGFVATLLLGELWQSGGVWASICPEIQQSGESGLKDAFVRIVVRQVLLLHRKDVDDINKVHKHGNIISKRQVALTSESPTVRQVLELALLKHKLCSMAEKTQNNGLLRAVHMALHPVHQEARNFHGKTPVQRRLYKKDLGDKIQRCLSTLTTMQSQYETLQGQYERIRWMTDATRLFVRCSQKPPETHRDLWLVLAAAVHHKEVPIEDLAAAVSNELNELDQSRREHRLRAFRNCFDLSLATYNVIPRSHLMHSHGYKRPRDAAGEQLSGLQTMVNSMINWHNINRFAQPRYSAAFRRMLKASDDLANAVESRKRRKKCHFSIDADSIL